MTTTQSQIHQIELDCNSAAPTAPAAGYWPPRPPASKFKSKCATWTSTSSVQLPSVTSASLFRGNPTRKQNKPVADLDCIGRDYRRPNASMNGGGGGGGEGDFSGFLDGFEAWGELGGGQVREN